ncbi:MAG: murein biosynthesis integral membrane protein MurJ [Candidatus Acidiferrales bacterium]
MTVKRQILRSATLIGFVTLISRICGYLRDQRVTLLLGTSPAADAFVLAFRIPNLIRRMTSEGALGASFIPVFAGYLRDKPRREALEFAQRMFWVTGTILAVVAVLGCVFSRQVVNIFTLFGGGQGHWELAVFLNRIIFPCVLFVGLAALAAAILNTFHVFGLPASTSILFNLVMIGFSCGVVYRPILRWTPEAYRSPAVALAFGVLAGAAVQLAVQIPALARRGMRFWPEISFRDPGVRRIGRLVAPAFFGMGVYQINFFVDTIFATSRRMPAGSVTSLYVADRVMELVLGSYAIAMSTALLPTMARQAAAGKYEEMKRAFGFSMRIVSFITIPAAVGLIVLRRPIIEVLFQHGRFAADSTALTAHALLFYSLGLPAFAALKLLAPMYYSVQDTMTPARVGAYTVGVHIALNAALLLFLFRYLSNGGPALASSLAAYFNFILLFWIFRKRYGRMGARGLAGSMAKMAVCAAAMAGASSAALRASHFAGVSHVPAQAAMLAAMIGASVGVYFGVAWMLRCEELGEFFSLFRRAEAVYEKGAMEGGGAGL